MKKEKGAALVIVLLVVFVLLGMGLLGLYLTANNTRMAANINMSTNARIVAEGGIEQAQAVLTNSTNPIAALLSGFQHAADEVPNSTTTCSGERRGAILVNTNAPHPQPLFKVSYPTITRADLPNGAGSVSATLGTYTVYIRQDLSDCRMKNYVCDTTSLDVDHMCQVPNGAPTPNGYVVLRAEGTAIDGTVEVIERTVKIRQSAPPIAGTGGSSGAGGLASGTGGNGAMGGSPGNGGTTGGGGIGGMGGSTGPCLCLNYAVSAVAPCPGGWNPGCIAINSGTKVNGYDSSLGPPCNWNYSPASIAMVCSQSNANASCPNNCSAGNCVSGTIEYNKPSTLTTGSLPAPTYVANANHLDVPPNTTLQPPTPSSVVYYDQVDVDLGTLTLKSGRYVINRFNLNSNGNLYIDDTDGPVTIWVLDFLSPSSSITVKSGKASGFWLIYNGTQDVNNNSNNNFTGVLFAPGARVNINYIVKGAIVGGNVALNSPARVYYDVNLKCVP